MADEARRAPGSRVRLGVHVCPCGCDANITVAQLACHESWQRLPTKLRQRMMLAYTGGSDSSRHFDALAEAAAWFAEHPAVSSA